MTDMGVPAPETPVDSVPAETLYARIQAGESLTVLDTRGEGSYEEWHIDGESVESINIPYTAFLGDELGATVHDRLPADRKIWVLCAKGISSEYVAGRLNAAGYETVHITDGMEGWAAVYETRRIKRYDGTGDVFQFYRPSSGCLSYLLCDDGQAAVVDPLRAFTDQYRRVAADNGATLEYAFDTHIHADHISGLRALAETGADGALPARSVARGVTDAAELTVVNDGDRFQVGALTIDAISTPGHTSGMTSYRVDDELLLTGDGLFVDSVARPDLETGAEGAPAAARQLHTSLNDRVLSLPASTLIAGGHVSDGTTPASDGTYTARLGTLQERLPLLSLSADAFVEAVLSKMPPRPANYETIIAINLGTEHREDALELELGPNNCAAGTEPVAGD